MNFSKELFKGIYAGVIFTLLPLVVLTVLTSKFPVFGIKSYIVQTGSMGPTIPTASLIYTIPSEEYKVGEIIAFKSGEIAITHRIAEVRNQDGNKISDLVSPLSGRPKNNDLVSYITKGDANNKVDSKQTSQKMVVGKVFLHFPFIGRFINDLKTPLGFILTIFIPTLIFVFMELWNIKKEIEREVENKLKERMRLL